MSQEEIKIKGYADNPQSADTISLSDFLGIQQGNLVSDMKKTTWGLLLDSIDRFIKNEHLDIFPTIVNSLSEDSTLVLGDSNERIFGTVFLEDAAGLSKIDITYANNKAQIIVSQFKDSKDVYSLEVFEGSIGLRRQGSDLITKAVFIGTKSDTISPNFCVWVDSPLGVEVEGVEGFSINNGVNIRKVFFNVDNLLTVSYEG